MNTITNNLTTIIFDFDYTLADSSRGVFSCINYGLSNLGRPRTSYEAACQTIGLSLQETFAALTGEPPEDGREFARLFVERAEEVMADHTILFDKIPETIQKLKSLDYRLGIVSTKFRYRIETILRREDLLAPFETIIGGEDVVKHKPDPESLLLALSTLEVSTKESLYIGDSVVDAQTAQSVGVPFIGVLSGVTTLEEFNGYRKVGILNSISYLPGWLLDERR